MIPDDIANLALADDQRMTIHQPIWGTTFRIHSRQTNIAPDNIIREELLHSTHHLS